MRGLTLDIIPYHSPPVSQPSPPVLSVGLHPESGRHEVGQVGCSQTLSGLVFTAQPGEDQPRQSGGHRGWVEVVGHVVE